MNETELRNELLKVLKRNWLPETKLSHVMSHVRNYTQDMRQDIDHMHSVVETVYERHFDKDGMPWEWPRKW